jgi:hypothetical protein
MGKGTRYYKDKKSVPAAVSVITERCSIKKHFYELGSALQMLFKWAESQNYFFVLEFPNVMERE